MRLVLEVASGPGKGRRIEADVGQTISVGRTKKANVALGDNFMSGAHFAIECRGNSCHVRDLKSRNGTKLNGQLITEAGLQDGDRLFAGRTDFIARIERAPKQVEVQDARVPSKAAEPRISEKPAQRRKTPRKSTPGSPDLPVQKVAPAAPAAIDPQAEPAPAASPELRHRPESPPAAVIANQLPAPAPEAPFSAGALESYEAATPQGRLFHILSNQPQTVLALLDAVRDARALELLRGANEEHQSLYTGAQHSTITPYLVRLPPRCDLLRKMIQLGWGNEWGVYLTCPLSLAELRNYYRTVLMVTMPDGTELFSRFYDPRFFRRFLETCSRDEAEKFFGPVSAYFMEDERPEILLEFIKSNTGTEKRGQLLSALT